MRRSKRSGIVGILISIVGLAYISPNYRYHVGDFYHSRPGFVAFVVGIMLAWVYLCHFAVEHIRPNRPFEVIYYWSKNVNVIYLVQWVLIMWGADLILGFNKSSIFYHGLRDAVHGDCLARDHRI